MRRLDAFVVFPPRYAATADGLAAAEQALARLVTAHAAYASQPNITPIWQGYIDKQAATVDAQRTLVETMRTAVTGLKMRSPASPDAVGGTHSVAHA